MSSIIEKKTNELQHKYKIIVYFALGALWSLSQVGYSFALLTWFTFVPFLFFIKYEKIKSGFFYTWLFGFSVYLFHLWWVPIPIAKVINLNMPFILKFLGWGAGWLLNIVICAYHGLLYSLIFLIAKYVTKNRENLFYFFIPIITTVLDYFFPKLWQDQIGYSQFVFFHFSQVADIFGIPGITFLIISCNAAVMILIESLLKKENIIFSSLPFLGVILIIILGSIYGLFRTEHITKISNNAPTAKIGVVQGNFNGIDKMDNKNVPKMIDTYNKLSIKIEKEEPELIIWPESAIPKYFDVNVKKYEEIKKFKKIPLLTGILLVAKEARRYKLYNSLVLISKNNEKIDHYNKIKLLPFAENLPLPFSEIILNIIGYGEFTKGKSAKIMSIGKINFSPNICYEAIFPNFIRKSLSVNNKKANLIINATNDSWYGNTIETKMHLHMTGFRAIENRISLVRATCTGYSAIFSPNGEIMHESPLYKKNSFVKKVPLLAISTIYKTWGWIFIWILTGTLLLMVFKTTQKTLKKRFLKSKKISKTIHTRDLHRLWLD